MSAEYVIAATITRVDTAGYSCTTQVPSFILSAAIQGIVDEGHAERIAREIIDPLSLADELHVTAVKITNPSPV